MNNSTLNDIRDKINSNTRISLNEALALYNENDLLFLGELARSVKLKKTNHQVFFNVNRHVNLTNVCTSRCKFCAFGCDENDSRAYTMTIEEVLKIGRDLPPNITELHIVSALHPHLPFDYYLKIIRSLKEMNPEVHLQAFTAVEIDYFSKIAELSVEEILKSLIEAGLGSLPGGGAEVFSPRVRETVCGKKASGERWLEIMETAHSLGLKTNATMLYGHIETLEERLDHLFKLRSLQDKTGGFQSFIPLPFHPHNTELSHLKRTTGYEDLKMIALSRLILDNITHIKSFWIMLGVPLAQLSLHFGADDLDGTVVEEKITHAAGAQTEQGISIEELIKLIREAGYTPVERDTLYNVIKVYKEGDELAP